MLLALVKDRLVSTAKRESLVGKKLLVVEVLSPVEGKLEGTGRHLVCIDTVGAGQGDLVLTVMGSSARLTPQTGDAPADAVIVGIVDSLTAAGMDLAVEGA